MYRDSSPGRESILAQVDALEARLSRLHESDMEITKILKSHGTTTIRDLDERRKSHENTIIATGNRVWQELLFIRGLGKTGEGDRTRWLPSDLIAVPEFKKLEAQARKQIDEAKGALPKVIEDLKKIEGVILEAQGL